MIFSSFSTDKKFKFMSHTQKIFIESGYGLVQLDLPPEKNEVLPSVEWGNATGFPTVAYWLYKVLEKRITGDLIRYKLGNSLLEEIGACLLGGHGIPAANGLAAYEHLRSKGAFDGNLYREEDIYEWLSAPIPLNGKTFKYRFAKQKAKYLHSAINKVSEENAPIESGKALRNWLLDIKGIGPKTASWIARNWLDADDVAILDIHIYRAGVLGGFFHEKMTIEKNYQDLEERFVALAMSMQVRTSELDAVMWYEMQNSPSVHRLLSIHSDKQSNKVDIPSNNRHSNTHQIALI
jgi:N-glycosylase/DNA lyase